LVISIDSITGKEEGEGIGFKSLTQVLARINLITNE
jgi:hypothetical protein